MTIKQKLLKFVYPLVIKTSKANNMNTKIFENANNIKPVTSIYDIPFELNSGETKTLAAYKNKKILIVNTASNCGYTNQYEGLERLFERHKDELEIVCAPCAFVVQCRWS